LITNDKIKKNIQLKKEKIVKNFQIPFLPNLTHLLKIQANNKESNGTQPTTGTNVIIFLINGGSERIRTSEYCLDITSFPSQLLRPLGHTSFSINLFLLIK
jgi:hypothetical protein